MANFTDHRAWTDLQPSSKLLPPNVIITAEELAVHGEAQSTSDLYQMGSETRKVVYDDIANSRKYYMELVLYVHPAGAADITLANAAGVSQVNGEALRWSGAQPGNTASYTNDDIAGFFLSHYYTATITPVGAGVNFIATTLTEGDAIWLVRRGMHELRADAAIGAAGVNLVCNNASAAGSVANATAFAATVAGIAENTSDLVNGKAVAIARGTALAAGNFLLCDIILPVPGVRGT